MKQWIFGPSLWALVLLFATSCGNSESDSTTSKTFKISDFSTLNLELVGEVIYEQGDRHYLNASGSSSLLDDLEVVDSNLVLSIKLKNKRTLTVGKKDLVIRVGSQRLKAVTFKGVGTFNLNKYFQAEKLTINHEGVGQMKIDDCHVGRFYLMSKSVGSIEVKGTSIDTYINSEGVGKIDCSKFKSKKVQVISKGAGILSVNAQDSLDISMAGIGNVNYYGNPTEVKTDISGLGKVTRMNP